MTYLLDSSVIIAAMSEDHTHHKVATEWLEQCTSFAVCPITEGALVRFMKRQVPEDKKLPRLLLAQMQNRPGYVFWSDDISYSEVSLETLLGPNQVTDAYLVALARSKGGKLATFDQALAAIQSDVELVAE